MSTMTTKRKPVAVISTRDRLADGSFVLRLSTQMTITYIYILTTDGHFRVRRYAPDATVEVQVR